MAAGPEAAYDLGGRTVVRHEGERHAHDGMTVQDYVRILKRRKWLLLVTIVLVPLAAVLWSSRQEPVYEATAEVLLSNQDISSGVTGVNSSTVFQTPDRVAQTQAELAMTPRVAELTLEETGIESITPLGLLGFVSVVPQQNADILDVSIRHGDPDVARRLASAYAEQFTVYKQELDTAAVKTALNAVETNIAELEATGASDTPLHRDLRESQQRLQTIEALQTRNAFIIRAPSSAAQVAPLPVRNGILGLMLGIVLGLGLAFLRDALDTRIRTPEEVSDRLGLPLLARLPAPPRRFAKHDALVMQDDPMSPEAEHFRMLRTNFEFVNLERGAQVVMITSAVSAEGKSTTASNLAAALARSGKRVALVDLDLRRPYIDRFFGLEGHPGLTQVALGHVELADAIVSVALPEGSIRRSERGRNGSNGHAKLQGVLDVLPSGPIPPDAGEFVGTQAVAKILNALREQHDLVIVDAPPLLQVGDAMALSPRVDAMILVARLKLLRQHMLRELQRLMENVPAKPLGLVVTGADEAVGYGYGYGSEVEPQRRRRIREPVA
jgi:polysaccharide biosynthesis transport protein